MREILFKAKRLDNGKWVEGLLWKKKYKSDKYYISCFPDYDDNEEVYLIDANTICQYTGLQDKNGNKIWENDVVRKTDTSALGWHRERICTVSFDKYGYWKVMTTFGDGYWLGGFEEEQIEVIGNIFDNPELVKVREDYER